MSGPVGSVRRGAVVPLPAVGIQTLIAQANAADPGAVAIRYGDQVLTRGELDERVGRWSAALTALGATADRPVAMLLPRSIEAIVAIVAILESGAGYLPLSCHDPVDRIGRILRDAGDPLVVTGRQHLDRLPGYPGRVVLVEELDGHRPAHPVPAGVDRPARSGAENLAYVVYTSGTSGEPKGVLGVHRQLVNYVRWCAEEFALRPGERAVLHAPLYFVGSVMTFFTALTAGWELEIAPEPVDVGTLVDLVATSSCGFLKLTPSHVRGMTALGRVDGIARLVMIGSEPLYLTGEFDRWIRGSAGARFANHYGMSETCGCTWWWIPPGGPVGERIPVGDPILNTDVLVLDPDGQPVPVGEPGELYIAGAAIGRGYHGQPALTAQRWVPYPWGAPGERMLRTGDLARMLPDGGVDVLGRADRQVKIRGHRVEPPSVEDALRRCPQLRDVVVGPVREGHEVALVAYLRAAGEERLTVAELRAHCARYLPDYAIPARFLYVAEFPTTPNGKVDLARLASTPATRPALATGYLEPSTPTEKTVAAVLAAVLGVDRVGVLDDFFELGGDSVQVVEVVTRIDEELGRELPVSKVFDLRTVRAMSRLVDARESGDAAGGSGDPAAGRGVPPGADRSVADVPPTAPNADGADRALAALVAAGLDQARLTRVEFTAVAGSAALTWGQLSIWRPMTWFGDGSSDFNIRRVLPVDPGVPPTDALAVWGRLVARHQALRSRFPDSPAGPRQEVVGHGGYPVTVVPSAPDRVAATADTALAALAALPFALGTEWPVRVILIQADGLVRALAVVASHVAVDGWALEQVLSQAAGLLAGAPADPAEVDWQPLDQARHEASEAGRRRGRQALEFWRRHLPTAPDAIFGPPGPAGPLPIRRWQFDSPAVAAAAQVLAERSRTSTSTVLLTATALALRALSGQDVPLLKLIAGNRYTARQRALVAAAAQDAVFACRPAGDVLATIGRAYRDSTESYFNACYDPDALAALVAAERDRRGVAPDLSAYFNDARLGRDWLDPLLSEVTRPALAALAGRGRLTELAALPKHDMSFYVTVFHAPQSCRLTLLADTRVLPAARCRRLLPGLGVLLREALFRAVGVDEVAGLIDAPTELESDRHD